MIRILSKIFTPVIILTLFYLSHGGGGFAVAQEVPTVVEEVPVITMVQGNEVVVQEGAPSQETALSQETIELATLENTTDVAQVPTAESIITDIIAQPENMAPSEPTIINVNSSEVTVVENLDNSSLNEENVISNNLILPNRANTIVESVAKVDFKPRGEYTFVIAGEKILTKKEPKWQKPNNDKDEDHVSTQPNIVIDNQSGMLTVSGECSEAYFVVLLYRNKDDYDNNPPSYILNRAHPCENNIYKYSISDLPMNLVGGAYYLLIAEQGERGPWKPISALTPLFIQ